jgi:hypothetical protein
MVCGWSPFYAEDTQQMYRQICFGKIRFPKSVIGDDGKQLVKGLLNRNPKHRLGAQRGAQELKEHAFFSCIDWDALAARQVNPPFKPFVECDESVANFDPEFTDADILKVAPFDDDSFDNGEPDLDDRSSVAADQLEATSLSRSQSLQRRGQNGGAGVGPLGGAGGVGSGGGAVAIGKPRPGTRPTQQRGSPLTRSVQDAFAGFSFVAGESGDEGDFLPPRRGVREEEALDMADGERPIGEDDDDDDDDFGAPRAGRMDRDGDDDADVRMRSPQPPSMVGPPSTSDVQMR